MAVGQLLGPHGLSGAIKLRSYSGQTDHLLGLAGIPALLKKDQVRQDRVVRGFKMLGAFLLVDIAGIDSPEQVRPVSGWQLWLDRQYATPLFSNEYYIADLIDCRLVWQGATVAVVKSVWDNGPTDMLEVLTNDQRIAHVPFSGQFVGKVDHQAKVIELLHDWILE